MLTCGDAYQMHAQRSMVLKDQLERLHDPTGLTIDRAVHFVSALGIRVSSYAVIDPKREGEAVAAFRQAGVEENKLPHLKRVSGRQYNDLDVSITYRLGGRQQTEHTFVHELAHSRQVPDPMLDLTPTERRKSLFRKTPVHEEFVPAQFSGLFYKDGGSLNEEGLATVIEANYAERSFKYRGINAYTKQPMKYERLRTAQHPYMPAALALEVLCARKPELVAPLFNTRRDPEASAEVTSIYNSIQPGLFSYTHELQNKFSGLKAHHPFRPALGVVLDAAGYTVKDISHICQDSPISDYVEEQLVAYEAETGYTFKNDEGQHFFRFRQPTA